MSVSPPSTAPTSVAQASTSLVKTGYEEAQAEGEKGMAAVSERFREDGEEIAPQAAG